MNNLLQPIPFDEPLVMLVLDPQGGQTTDPTLHAKLSTLFNEGVCDHNVESMKEMLRLAGTIGCASTFRFTAYTAFGPKSFISPFTNMAMGRWKTDIAGLLLDMLHGIDDADNDGGTALHAIVQKDDPVHGNTNLRAVLEAGADVNRHDRNGSTALMDAASNGSMSMVRILLDAGADANKCDYDGTASYEIAEANGHHAIADLLRPLTTKRWIPSGIEPYSQRLGTGYSILHCLAEMGLTANVQGITHRVPGYKPPRTDGGMTPAHVALLHGFVETAVAALGPGGSHGKLEPLMQSLRKKGFKVPEIATLIIYEISGTTYRSI
ncbi:ankyrin repeat domain-containing protein [Burkholderia glumae]|uniref:ankyrin repeat domain-containing protein n=1 Tax=Burkholderia glumae TaxID=337 RepID=UPI00214FA282|nr:ankyrin repeat domain-containing protein [Burkholderia glumae]